MPLQILQRQTVTEASSLALLARTDGADREKVYERLIRLVPAPPGVTSERVPRGEKRDLESWRWEPLGMPILSREGSLQSFCRKIWFRLAGA